MVALFYLAIFLVTKTANGEAFEQPHDDLAVFDELYYVPKSSSEVHAGRKKVVGSNYAVGQLAVKKDGLKQAMKFLCPPIVCNADWRPTKRRVLQ
uniref:Uncharacterized protein n=1 Tax=Trichuris muris TaxID=70415 RepID=A0A5S6QD71_TRIMR